VGVVDDQGIKMRGGKFVCLRKQERQPGMGKKKRRTDLMMILIITVSGSFRF